MKKSTLKTLSLLACAVLAFGIVGCGEESDNTQTTMPEEVIFYDNGFTYQIEGDVYKIIGFAGAVEEVTIAETFRGKPVVSIEDKAFKDGYFSTIHIPEGSYSWLVGPAQPYEGEQGAAHRIQPCRACAETGHDLRGLPFRTCRRHL